MLRTNSLAFRLSAIAAVWSLLGLIAGSYVLASLFRDSGQGSFDTRLLKDLENVVAPIDLDPDGSVKIGSPLVDPRFLNPFSGWYWQILPAGPPTAEPAAKPPAAPTETPAAAEQ